MYLHVIDIFPQNTTHHNTHATNAHRQATDRDAHPHTLPNASTQPQPSTADARRVWGGMCGWVGKGVGAWLAALVRPLSWSPALVRPLAWSPALGWPLASAGVGWPGLPRSAGLWCPLSWSPALVRRLASAGVGWRALVGAAVVGCV